MGTFLPQEAQLEAEFDHLVENGQSQEEGVDLGCEDNVAVLLAVVSNEPA